MALHAQNYSFHSEGELLVGNYLIALFRYFPFTYGIDLLC